MPSFTATVRSAGGVQTATVESGRRYRLTFGPGDGRPITGVLTGVDWNQRTDSVSLFVQLDAGPTIGVNEAHVLEIEEVPVDAIILGATRDAIDQVEAYRG